MPSTITLPSHFNYIALFLTLSCNLKCPYCINLNEAGASRKSVMREVVSAKVWLDFLNRLEITSEDLPLTFQGGEPTLYPYFYERLENQSTSCSFFLRHCLFCQPHRLKTSRRHVYSQLPVLHIPH